VVCGLGPKLRQLVVAALRCQIVSYVWASPGTAVDGDAVRYLQVGLLRHLRLLGESGDDSDTYYLYKKGVKVSKLGYFLHRSSSK
jgi:hypothetical protein